MYVSICAATASRHASSVEMDVVPAHAGKAIEQDLRQILGVCAVAAETELTGTLGRDALKRNFQINDDPARALIERVTLAGLMQICPKVL